MGFPEIFILINFFLLIYGYLLYPLLISQLAKVFKKDIKSDTSYQPEITVLISAYNEEDFIHDAVVSIFSTSYPIDKIKVIVGSDGSTDHTFKILEKLKEKYSSLTVTQYERSGKNKILNYISKEAKTDIVFYMDADCRLQDGIIQSMVSNFADPYIGVVIAGMESLGEGSDSSGGAGELIYQKIEKIFRISESKISSTVNSLGAFYAVRKDLLKPIPNDMVADDYYPIILALIKRYRVIFLNNVNVLEVRGKSTGDEFQRRIRASSSSMAGLWEGKQLLLPHYGWTSFFLWSHKICRWLAPLFQISILIFTFFIDGNKELFLFLICSQVVFYISVLLGFYFEKKNIKILPFKIALYAFTMSLGLALAIFRFIGRKKNSMWARV